jgi:hypothetical protein
MGAGLAIARRIRTTTSGTVRWAITITAIALPALLPLTIYAASELLLVKATIFSLGIDIHFDVAHDYKYFFDGSVAGHEANARYFVATSLLVLLFVSVGATLTSAWIIFQNFKPLRRNDSYDKRGLWAAAVFIIVLLVLTLTIAWLHKARLYEYVGRDVFPYLLQLYFTGRPGLPFEPATIMSNLLKVTSTLAIIAAVFVTVCCGTFLTGLSDPGRMKTTPYTEIKSFMSGRVVRLKILLVAASLCFVAGLLHFKAWQAWPLALMKEDSVTSKQYSLLTEGLTTYEGTRFALVLISILACTVLGLRFGASRILARRSESVDQLFTDSGLTFSVPEIVRSTMTVIAPLLVGPVVSVLQGIAGN